MDEDTPMKMRYQYLPAAIILLAAVCLCGVSAAANAGIEVRDLRCEYLANPQTGVH